VAEFTNVITKKILDSELYVDEVEYWTKQIELTDSSKLAGMISFAAKGHDKGKDDPGISGLVDLGRHLAEAEKETVATHSELGVKAMNNNLRREKDAQLLNLATVIAKYHHEKWDGTGRLGMCGTEIPLPARIVAIADVYDALTSKRPYKESIDEESVIQMIRSVSGSHLDPLLVEAVFGVQS